MNEKLNLTKANGTTVQADVICFLEDITDGKRYLYYTLNEIDGAGPNSTVKIYVGKVQQNDANLDMPISEEEWNKLKNYMGDTLKGNTIDNIRYLPLTEPGVNVIVNEKVIAMPTSYDYINKHRGVYAQCVATMEPVAPVVEPVAPQAVEPQVVEPTPVAPEAPVVSENPAPVMPEAPIEPQVSANLNPIDINEIEAKYASMMESLNNLKNQEIEAAKRYNATLELSAMHNEQHASYVASEQSKEVAPEPVMQQPIEPTPVTPQVPEPLINPATQGVQPGEVETNWFDMPNQGTK